MMGEVVGSKASGGKDEAKDGMVLEDADEVMITEIRSYDGCASVGRISIS